MRLHALLVLGTAVSTVADVRAQEPALEDSLEARIWLDRGEEPVVQRGDAVRIFYRTSHDAYAAIFRIDTDGRVQLLFPQDPDVDTRVRGGRDYRLLFPRSPIWRVGDDPGAGYFFMVASPEPLDLSGLGYDPARGWDLSAVGDVVYEDPYVAIDSYVAYLIPDWEQVPYALDFITYSVGETHTYPRFLCYDCHDFRRYSAWNPYAYTCSTYRVVIWDDPYFYPSYRYSGTRVVVARFRDRPRYAVLPRGPGEPWRPLVLTREAPPRRVAQYKEPAGAAGVAQPERRGAVSRPAAATTRGGSGGSTAGRPLTTRGPEVGARSGTPERPAAPIRRGAAGSAQERAPQEAPPRGGARAPTGTEATQERPRPTLQRRPSRPSGRLPLRRPPSASDARALREDDRSAPPTPAGRAARPLAPAPRGPDARGAVRVRPSPADARAPVRRPDAAGTPSRPGARGVPARPDVSRPERGAVRQPPSRGGRPAVGPGASRPPVASARPPTRGRPTLRPSTARPTVQPRRPPPRRPPPRRPGG
jgi:hypothetical protein